MQVSHEPKITDHAWLKIELNENKMVNKYREYIAREYKNFDKDKFC